MLPATIRARLDALPGHALVLDVGGWARPDPRADWVIDIGSYDTRNYYSRELGEAQHGHDERFTRDTWVETDICSSAPWPFDDDMFDFVICSHTLEDVRDPIRVCEEMTRVGKAGYVETPTAVIELTRGIESHDWCGWRHHRWLVTRDGDDRLAFLGKPHHIHSPLWPSVRSPRLLTGDAVLGVEWDGRIRARESVLVDREDLDTALLQIVAAGARRDPAGDLARAARRRSDEAYRAARRAAAKWAGRR